MQGTSQRRGTVTTTVTVIQRGEWQRQVFAARSREEGMCLNWPPAGAETKPDLRLRFTDPALGSPLADGTSITTDDLVEEAALVVDAYDFGAWGTLRISATDKNQRDVVVKIQGRQTPDLAIPLDEDANQIADAWKPALTKDQAGDADDEHQDGNENDGDGLTVYEEYRGFVENFGNEGGGHHHADPSAKDFFVLNLAGEDAVIGLNLFASATRLNVHSKFSRTELDPFERRINRYSSAGSPQHGVVIEWADRDPGYSEAIGGPGTPIDVSSVKLSRKKLADVTTPVPGTAYSAADVEVAHELAHAVNVYHHGESDWEKGTYVAGARRGEIREIGADRPQTVRVFIENGPQLSLDEIGGREVWLGRESGQCSGAEECVMRYVRGGLLAYRDNKEPDVRRLLAGSQRYGKELCRSGNGTGVNEEGRDPQPAWGDAAEGRGSCFGQIMVKDRVQSGRGSSHGRTLRPVAACACRGSHDCARGVTSPPKTTAA